MGSSSSIFSPLPVSQYIAMIEQYSNYQISQQTSQINVYNGMTNLTGKMTTLLNSLQSSVTAIQSAFTATQLSIASSNTAAVAVTSQSIVNPAVVAPSSYAISVTQLAQSQQYQSSGVTGVFSSQTASLNLTGGLTFTNSSTSAQFTVNVAAGDSLQNIRDNINNQSQNFGVTASILPTTVSGTTTFQLVLTSTQTGNANTFTVADSTGAFNLSQTTAAKDALFTLDSGSGPVSEDSSTNIVSNVIDGVSFTLLPPAGSSTLTISANTQSLVANVQTAITNFVSSYNAALSFIDGSVADNGTGAHFVAQKPSGQTPPAGGVGDDALGDSTFMLVKEALQNALQNISSSGLYTALQQIGITTAPDSGLVNSQYNVKYASTGQLQINSATADNTPTLANALSSNFSAVQSLMTNSTNGLVSELTNAINGVLNGTPQNPTGILAAENAMITAEQNQAQQQLTQMQFTLSQTTQNLTDRLSAINGILAAMSYTNQLITAELGQSSSSGG